MSKPARKLSQAWLRSLLYCDPIAGKLFWRPKPGKERWNKRYACKETFGICANGYRFGKLCGMTLPAHRVIWTWVHGTNPPIVDHIDGDPSNNSITNLRAANHAVNARNQRMSTRNTSGAVGVFWLPRKKRWIAKIGYENAVIRIGSYKTKEEAMEARRRAQTELGFTERHGTRAA